jgi:peptidoglycan-associated lipoprotein
MSQHKIHLVLGAVAMALAGCSSTPVSTPPTPQPMATPSNAPVSPAPAPRAAATPTPTAASTVKTVTLPPYLDPRSSLSTARSVYFDFDDAALKPEFNALVEQHGKYLASNPSLTIRVEGNTDERGSAEYNLALGQKRAQVVVRALKIYGVRDAQVEAVSWGEEKPKANAHDESAWAQNRRADVQYPTK